MPRRKRRSSRSYWGPEPDYESAPTRPQLRQQLGRDPAPVRGEGRNVAQTVWGKAWCHNLERYHDYANRLPRGRTYLRQGAVLDLWIAEGEITALVSGHSLYEVHVQIDPVPRSRWSALRKRCSGQLSSVIELLEGRVGAEVMEAVTEPGKGLFPEPRAIRLECSCPDWATMCKHVAAAMYGVGIRLDEQPQLLFELRGVEPGQLVKSAAQVVGVLEDERRLVGGLSEIFGVMIDDEVEAAHGRRGTSKKNVTMTRQELLARGVPASTVQGWLRRRILRPTARPGVYRMTKEAFTCLEGYG